MEARHLWQRWQDAVETRHLRQRLGGWKPAFFAASALTFFDAFAGSAAFAGATALMLASLFAGATALLLASLFGHVKVVQVLLANKAQ